MPVFRNRPVLNRVFRNRLVFFCAGRIRLVFLDQLFDTYRFSYCPHTASADDTTDVYSDTRFENIISGV